MSAGITARTAAKTRSILTCPACGRRWKWVTIINGQGLDNFSTKPRDQLFAVVLPRYGRCFLARSLTHGRELRGPGQPPIERRFQLGIGSIIDEKSVALIFDNVGRAGVAT